MASGELKSWVLNTGTIDGKSCAGAYYLFTWSSAWKSNGTTTVSWELHAKGRTSSPTQLENTIDLDLYNGTTKVSDLYTITDSQGKEETRFDNYLRASGSFDITHNTSGAATFTIKMVVSIWDTGTHDTEDEFTLDNNKPNRTLTLTGGSGTSNYTGGGAHRIGDSVTINTTVASGYTWSKWTSGSASGTTVSTTKKYTFNMPTSNVTYYANATKDTYSISYSGVSSGYDGKTSYTVTDDAYSLPTPSKTGYTFEGWTGSNGSTKQKSVTIAKGSTEDKTYTANWTAHTYTVSYNGNGNTGGSTTSSTHTYDTPKPLTENEFTRAYTVTYNANGGNVSSTSATASYSFSGWATSSTGNKAYDDKQEVTNLTSTNNGTVTLYAKWTGGAVKLPTPSRTGYTFAGWYDAESGGNKIGNAGANYTATAAITLYARWTANSYTVTFNTNGGSTPDPETKSVTYAGTYGTLPSVSRTGYTFKGWYTAKTGGSKVTSSTNVTTSSNHTLYARWTARTFTVTFDANGGSTPDPESKSVTYDSTYGTLAETTKTGYTFNGWYTAKSGGTQIISSTRVTITADQTLYAHWGANTDTVYTVKHWKQKIGTDTTQNSTNYTEVIDDRETKTGTTAATTNATAKTYTGFTASDITQKTVAANNSTVVNVYYTRNSYTLTLSKGTGIKNVSGGGEKQYGATVSISSTDKDGYTFSSWTSSVSGVRCPGSNSGTITMPASDVTLTANAAPNTNTTYTIKHWKQKLTSESTTQNSTNYDEDTSVRETKTGTTDTDTAVQAKTLAGFTATEVSQKTIKGDGTTVVNVYYTRNSYTVSLSIGTGVATVTGAGTYKYQQSVTVTADMLDGYTWSRWSGDKSSTSAVFTFTMPASNVQLLAKSTANGYTVTYVGQKGKQAASAPRPGATSNIEDEVTYNEIYTIRKESNAFTRTGYKFLGWATSEGSKVVSSWTPGSSITWTRTDDLLLYAIWKSKGVLYVDNGSEFIPYTIWIDSGATTGGPNNNGWYQYTAWLDTGDESQGTNGWVQLGSLPD